MSLDIAHVSFVAVWCLFRLLPQETKTAPTTWFIKRCLGLTTGAKQPGREEVGVLPLKAVYEIAKLKQPDTPNKTLESVAKQIVSTARSMGIGVEARAPVLPGDAAAKQDA